MRVGFGVSIAAHVAVLAFGLIAFPEARPFAVDDIEALPVDLIELSDKTDLKLGDEKAEKKPADEPQPKPTVKAEQPTPKAAEKPAEKPVEAAREPAPKPVRDVAKQPTPEPPKPQAVAEQPKAEPPPAPPARPQQMAALPQPSEPAPAEEVAPQTAPTPRQRPKPPAQPAAATPEPAKPKPPETQRTVTPPAPPTPQQQQFNPDDIAALLDKQQPAGGGDPMPLAEPQTLGSIEGRQEAAMTQSKIEALKAMLYRCWNPPRGVREAGALRVTVVINLLPDGSLAAQPRVIDGGMDPLSQIAAESAIRAVQICAPYQIFPPEEYEVWREITVIFDPREMLGG